MNQKFYIGYSKNEKIVKKSSSGGMFYSIANEILTKETKAKVYGCALDNKLDAKHIGISNIKDIAPILGSKYINSNLSGIYNQIIDDLQNDYTILFCGTPCQIHVLNTIISKKKINRDKLYTIDFVCHGVCKTEFFKDYIKYLEKKYKSVATNCNFRTKNKVGKLQDMSVTFKNGKKYIASTTKLDWFYSAYLKNLSIREECFNCKFTNFDRNSDITLADAWGNFMEGCWSPSLIIINTKKGQELFEKTKTKIKYKKIEQQSIHNPQLYQNLVKPEQYDEFNKIYKEKGFYEAQKFIGNNCLTGKIKTLCANILYKIK